MLTIYFMLSNLVRTMNTNNKEHQLRCPLLLVFIIKAAKILILLQCSIYLF